MHIPRIDEATIKSDEMYVYILHSIAKIFDPLGLTSITYHGKVFLQKLWKIDQSWDEPLSNDLIKD